MWFDISLIIKNIVTAGVNGSYVLFARCVEDYTIIVPPAPSPQWYLFIMDKAVSTQISQSSHETWNFASNLVNVYRWCRWFFFFWWMGQDGSIAPLDNIWYACRYHLDLQKRLRCNRKSSILIWNPILCSQNPEFLFMGRVVAGHWILNH